MGTLFTKDHSDAMLVELSAGGDAAAFTEIYRRHKDKVYAFVFRMLKDGAAAEDVTHETFVFLIEQPRRYEPDRSSLATFLCGVARRRVMNLLRRHYRNDASIEGEELVIGSTDHDDALTQLLDRERNEQIELEISRLSPTHREVLILREFGEMSYDEIAAITETEVATVKTRLHRARQSLARSLGSYAPHERSRERGKEISWSVLRAKI